jgi:hypothetical protein
VLVGVSDHEADGTSRRLALEDATEQLYLVGFLARRGDGALTGTPPVEFLLDESQVYLDACRHAVHDTADGLAVTLTKGGQSEYLSEGVHFVGVMGVG